MVDLLLQLKEPEQELYEQYLSKCVAVTCSVNFPHKSVAKMSTIKQGHNYYGILALEQVY